MREDIHGFIVEIVEEGAGASAKGHLVVNVCTVPDLNVLALHEP